MLLKVEGGTPKGGCKSLCASCRNATSIEGSTYRLISCTEISSVHDHRLNEMQPIVKCSSYDDKSMPSLSHMKDIAWELKPNKKTGRLGFHMPDRKNVAMYDPASGKDLW